MSDEKVGKELWDKIEKLLDAKSECDFAEERSSNERVLKTHKEYSDIETELSIIIGKLTGYYKELN